MKQPKVTRRKITDYIPDNHNANLGSERGLQMIEHGLNKVGAGRSIVVDAHDRIPAGNKTLEAAVLAGIEDVIEIESDGKALIVHKRTDWDLDDPTGAAREYAYLDNQASAVSLNWDANVIAADVEAGVNLDSAFYDWEVDKIMGNAQDVTDREALWGGMPEFENNAIEYFHTIKVVFNSEEDMIMFSKLVSQTITNKTPLIYYPCKAKYESKKYIEDES